AHDADTVIPDRIPALDVKSKRCREYGWLDVIDRRRDLHQRGIGLRKVGDPVHLAVEFAVARERQRPLAGDVGELDRNIQPRIDRPQYFAADELVGDVSYSRELDDRLRVAGDAGHKHRNADEEYPPHESRLPRPSPYRRSVRHNHNLPAPCRAGSTGVILAQGVLA